MDLKYKLPIELRQLVRILIGTLGQVILSASGQKIFDEVERLRIAMKDLRGNHHLAQGEILEACFVNLKTLNAAEQFSIAHAFALKLELINAAENAYRTFRLEQKKKIVPQNPPKAIVFVLTAHPTESRSVDLIHLFFEIQELCLRHLRGEEGTIQETLTHLIFLAWKIPTAKNKSPSIQDEARHIYSIVFRESIIASLIEMKQRGINIQFRTWVGGDKDGHPGVNAKVFLESLSMSRQYIARILILKFNLVKTHLNVLQQGSDAERKVLRDLGGKLVELLKNVSSLAILKKGDGKRVVVWLHHLKRFTAEYKTRVGAVSPDLEFCRRLTEIFPALVMAVEFRESAFVLNSKTKDPATQVERTKILGMLKCLGEISQGGNPRWYVRGFVVSMVQSAEDILAAKAMVEKYFPLLTLPIVPLFETAQALTNAKKILSAAFQDQPLLKAVKTVWKNSMEVMVGYSDSAKEMGPLGSRVLIQQTLFELNTFFKKQGIRPVFFHGSGGSLARGGGSIEEQIAWWPKASREFYKATIQGEMVQRSFSTNEITKSIILKIAQMEKIPVRNVFEPLSLPLRKFIALAQGAYQQKLREPDFLKLIEQVTTYRYLDLLKIGSRPVSRKPKISLDGLRAIPWVLCWTQTRILFPSWWGLGLAWSQLNKKERDQVKKEFSEREVLSSFLKQTAFTLRKIEMEVWKMYVEKFAGNAFNAGEIFSEFKTEYEKTLLCVREISGKKDLLWYRPWLGESVALRSTMIHPLNLLQIIAIQNHDEHLLRETATGISCGMVTTG